MNNENIMTESPSLALRKQYFGWYSPTQARLYGSVIYTTPEGKEVEVTEIIRGTWRKSRFAKSDSKFRGEVDFFVRNCKEPEYKSALTILAEEIYKTFGDDSLLDDPFEPPPDAAA